MYTNKTQWWRSIYNQRTIKTIRKKFNLQICWKLHRYTVHATHKCREKGANRTHSKHDILLKWKQQKNKHYCGRKNKCFLSTSFDDCQTWMNEKNQSEELQCKHCNNILYRPKKIDNLSRGGKIDVNIKKNIEKNNRTEQCSAE